ncbi:hypothetical protein CK203_098109 [Vitis vinifera]|uniref:Uncharacterized protein n=1 Tax=Vitis vinifera TaxID=29760 RepID=A0A438C630_VITVI|nr:hypothetical protein CK203_098109 [Vitis vinifera]
MAEMCSQHNQQIAILCQIQQHLGLLPPPQPDLPASSEPLVPIEELFQLRTLPHQRFRSCHLRRPQQMPLLLLILRMSLRQLTQSQLHLRMHHLH